MPAEASDEKIGAGIDRLKIARARAAIAGKIHFIIALLKIGVDQVSAVTLSPEILEPMRRQLRVAHSVLDIPMVRISLQGPCVMPLIGQGEPAGKLRTAYQR
jgi:hypothetical protein